MTDQYAIYRVNLLTEGKNLWQKSFEQVRKEHLPVDLISKTILRKRLND